MRCKSLLNKIIFPVLLPELPDDTPVVDLHKLVDLDFSKMTKMEKSGERMLRDVQEWMLSERSSSECAVLPEDTLQRIMVGVRSKFDINTAPNVSPLHNHEIKHMFLFSTGM